MTSQFLAIGLIWYIVFLFSTTCHEGAHALVGHLGGDSTAFLGGQVTLNPIPHIRREPFGMVAFPILTYLTMHWMMGWASAPYNPAWQQRYPRRAAWMALAGPAANFALVLLAGIAIHVGMHLGFFGMPEGVSYTRVTQAAGPGFQEFAATFLSILFALNLLLGTFNLLPFPPLDGTTGITLLMTEGAALKFQNFMHNPTFRMVGLLLAWFAYGKIFGFIFGVALAALYPGSHWG